MLVSSLILPLCGRVIDARGGRKVLLCVAVPFCVTVAALSLVHTWWQLLLGFTAMRLLGAGVLGLIATVALNRWYHQYRGVAAAAVSLAATLSSFAIASRQGVAEAAHLLVALCSAVALAVCACALRDSPGAIGLRIDCRGAEDDALHEYDEEGAAVEMAPLPAAALDEEPTRQRTPEELDAAVEAAAAAWRRRVEVQRRAAAGLPPLPPEDAPTLIPNPTAAESGAPDGSSVVRAVSTLFFWSVVLVQFLCTAVWSATIGEVMAEDALGPTAAGAIVGACVCGALLQRCSRAVHITHACLCAGPCAVCLALLIMRGESSGAARALLLPLAASLGLMKASNDAVGLAVFAEVFGTRHLGAIAGVANAAAVLCAPLVSDRGPTAVFAIRGRLYAGGLVRSEAIWLVGTCLAGLWELLVAVPQPSFTAQGHARLATTSESEPPSPHASPVLKAATSRQLIKELKRLSSQRSAAI